MLITFNGGKKLFSLITSCIIFFLPCPTLLQDILSIKVSSFQVNQIVPQRVKVSEPEADVPGCVDQPAYFRSDHLNLSIQVRRGRQGPTQYKVKTFTNEASDTKGV